MALKDVIQNIDIRKIKAPSGLTYENEMVRMANLLRDCIQSKINRGSMGNCLSVADIADIQVDGTHLSVTLNVQNAIRPSIFHKWNQKEANVFWLLNDGYSVKKDVWFKNIPNFGYRIAEHFVEQGIEQFNLINYLGLKIEVKRPLLYYG